MKQIYDTLLAVRHDIVSTQLKPEVQTKLDEAIKHLMEIVPHIHTWKVLAALYEKSVQNAQVATFRNFSTPQGRFLGREAYCYPKCANS